MVENGTICPFGFFSCFTVVSCKIGHFPFKNVVFWSVESPILGVGKEK